MNPGDVAIKREDEGSKETCNHFRTISKTRARSAFETENTCCFASGSPDRDECPLRDRCETDCAHGAGIGTTGQEWHALLRDNNSGRTLKKGKDGIVSQKENPYTQEKTGMERAYVLAERLGLSLWGEDEAGPYQTIPHPGFAWHPEGEPGRQDHQYIRWNRCPDRFQWGG